MKRLVNVEKSDALIIVDVQKDFCPKGALPIPEGDQIVPVFNDYIKLFTRKKAKIFATRDWHPPNHNSFKEYGGPWPPHCIQHTEGAKFHPDLKIPSDASIVSKAMDPTKEGYSGFDGTELAEGLKSQGITRVFVGGLATEYCVKNTVLDSLKLGFATVLLTDATRGLEVTFGDTERALNEMSTGGAEKSTLAEFADIPEIPEETEAENVDEKPLAKADFKKHARSRSRGVYRQVKTER